MLHMVEKALNKERLSYQSRLILSIGIIGYPVIGFPACTVRKDSPKEHFVPSEQAGRLQYSGMTDRLNNYYEG